MCTADISNPSYMGVGYKSQVDKGWSYSMPEKKANTYTHVSKESGVGNVSPKKTYDHSVRSPTGKACETA